MIETTLQFAAILVTVAGLLGWLLKQVITYFIKAANEKMAYIETLVAQNQKNVENFTNTVNHQRTLDRDMHEKSIEAIRELSKELHISNQVSEKMLESFKKQP